jgi:dTDP-4-amino-4,6-dideoxygalactose transaminase
MCLTAQELSRRLTNRSHAVIPVHFAGRPCDIEDIVGVAVAHGLAVVEDCAHAIETLVGGRHVGTFGDFAAFSFYATTNVATGEGGHGADAGRRAREPNKAAGAARPFR